MERYANKRMMIRGTGGQFRQPTMQDVGIGGVCPVCNHFFIRHYDGDPRDTSPDPRRFRYRCFTCEPLTDAEKALAAEIESAQPKRATIFDVLKSEDGHSDTSTDNQ
jgi:hypothetical protein